MALLFLFLIFILFVASLISGFGGLFLPIALIFILAAGAIYLSAHDPVKR